MIDPKSESEIQNQMRDPKSYIHLKIKEIDARLTKLLHVNRTLIHQLVVFI